MPAPARTMQRPTSRARLMRWGLVIAALLVALAIAGVAFMHFAARSLKDKIEDVLGPESSVSEIKVGLTNIEILGIEVPAPKGWPAKTALSAERIVVVPELRQLFSDRIHITRIDIYNGQISVLRPTQGGLRVLPNLARRVDKKKQDGDSEERGAVINQITLESCVIDLYDQSVILSQQRIRAEGVTGKLEDIQLPELAEKMTIDLKGTIRGAIHNGTISVKGWTNVAAEDSQIDVVLRNVDPSVFGPYFMSVAKSSVQTGSMDLDFKSTVRKGTIHAPGTLTITKLKLQSSDSPFGAIAQLPRRAVIGALADEQDRIIVNFLVHGNMKDPQFDINRNGGPNTGVTIAKALGLNMVGVLRAFVLILYGIGSSFESAAQR